MLSVVIQAGGKSQRMGQDKALLPFLGQPLIQRVATRLAPLADELLVTTNRPDSYRFLGLSLIPDAIPGRGALGGLLTALQAAQHEFVAVVACDMPFVNPDLLQAAYHLLSAAEEGPYDAVIPQSENGTEPFHAVYRRATCLPAVQTVIQDDKWKVNAWFPLVRLRLLTPQEWQRYDPQQLAFRNVNTPEDFQAAERMARARLDPPGTRSG